VLTVRLYSREGGDVKRVVVMVAVGVFAAIAATVAGAAVSAEAREVGCHPSYRGACLKTGIGDYDCGGGSGNGPNYVWKTVRVVGPDVFRLDGDRDGYGCEPY
jgi:hypothetical protein